MREEDKAVKQDKAREQGAQVGVGRGKAERKKETKVSNNIEPWMLRRYDPEKGMPQTNRRSVMEGRIN